MRFLGLLKDEPIPKSGPRRRWTLDPQEGRAAGASFMRTAAGLRFRLRVDATKNTSGRSSIRMRDVAITSHEKKTWR
jgi:hypothetical protein